MSWYLLLGFVAVFDLSAGHPIDARESLGSAATVDVISLYLVAVAFLVLAIFCVALCACCRDRNDGFKPDEEQPSVIKEFTNPGSTSNVGFTNALASTEVAIFPPPGADSGQSIPVGIQYGSPLGPLPPSKPAAFSSAVPDVSDWFADANANFPRQQLFYQKEIGKGWFGKVVEGEARGSKVIVRILREDATPEEKSYFLHEARPYRDLRHKNIVRLFGRCLEIDPYLLLFELQNNKDLKNFLVANSGSRRAINEQGINLKMMTDVCEGIKFMNENGFIHTDLAARNCLVTADLTVKVGDYGTSIDIYKNEYYIAGDVAVPIRWCAPETLHCTSTTIETKQVTPQANVWSVGVLLWEISEFGRLPYDDLTDDQVIVRVFGGNYRLGQPDCPFGQYLYNIMQICWKPSESRASIDQVLSMLLYLKTNPFQESDFEARWRKLKPNTVPVVDNHTPIHSPRHTELAQRPRLPAKSEFDSGVDLEIKPADENQDSCKTSTPMTISPQMSVTSEDMFQSQKKSPSLTNLQGSFEDMNQFDSWLQGVENKTEEDRTFVRNISEAIKNLDETLALEKTSSSSADSSLDAAKKPMLDFKLGPLGGRKSESSSDTEEETWRYRVERGEFTEKVKEKSKSVTDLMVLTHIDSEDSENDSLPSLTKQYSLKRSGPKGTTFTSIGFGSEGNIRNAILSEELQEKLKSLTIFKPDSFLGKTTTSSKVSEPQTETSDVRGAPSSTDAFLEMNSSNRGASPSQVEFFLENEVRAASIESTDVEKPFLAEVASEKSTPRELATGDSVLSESPVETNSNCIDCNVVIERETRDNEHVQSTEATVKNIFPLESPNLNLSSSHLDCVPKIVITESELVRPEIEPEINVETQHLIEVKPRKFVFVCREDEDEECAGPFDFKSDELAEESSVILGSSEEHTLDFFKGLKTTFSPVEYSDDEDKDWSPSPTSANDECLEDEHTSESTVVVLQNRLTLEDLSSLSVQHSCDDNTETFESSPTNSDICFAMNSSSETCPNSDDRQSKMVCPIENGSSSDVDSPNKTTEKVASLLDNQESMKDSGCEVLINGKADSLSNSEVTTKHELTTDDSYSEMNSSSSHDSPVYSKEMTKSSESNNLEVNPASILKKPLCPPPPPPTKIILNKVSKSKSLESVLCAKGELDAFKPLSDLRSEAVPVFSMVEMITEDVFPNNNSFDSYFSIDSGHSSDRCVAQGSDRSVDQDKQMNDLKNRLEDVVKYNDDFQLRNSEDEYGGKLLTPDDERSSDSGFRDKGSLSESVEDTCDDKYNLEDIDAELDDCGLKAAEKEELKYYNNIDFTPEEMEKGCQNVEGWFLHPKNNESDVGQSGWLPLSTENEERQMVTLDDEFVKAIRTELSEKLPCAQNTPKTAEEPIAEPEQEIIEPVVQFMYPAQLSPILEEQESNQSSLIVDDMSPIFILPPPEINIDAFREDIIRALEADESPDKDSLIIQDPEDEIMFPSDLAIDDDVLVINTETNEVTMIESPKPQSQLSFILPGKTETIQDDDSTGINTETYIVSPADTYVVSSDYLPLTPDISLGSNTLSSPENGNMSGMFMSPCSIRSDLFDSGPPSLPFDLGQSIDEVEDIFAAKSNSVQDLVEAGVVNKEVTIDENDSELTTIQPVYSKVEEPQLMSVDIVNIKDGRVTDRLTPKIDDSPLKCADGHQEPSDEEDSPARTLTPKAPSPSVNPPKIVVEEDTPNHVKAEMEIDFLIEKTDCIPSAVKVKEEKIAETKKDPNIWLEELLRNSGPAVSDSSKADNIEQGWPSNEELLTSNSSDDTGLTLKPNLNSTLALMSPDLSLTDSKSHSLLSSFSSTPTYEEAKAFPDNKERNTPTSLVIGNAVCAPMPSPEDAEKGWRPTICQLMELTDQADGEEMTTSFIEPDENGLYTPDWDSDTSDEQSSSSGEFVWKEGDRDELVKTVSSDTNALLQEPVKMERIDEEEEDDHQETDSDDSSSEGSGTEFAPSTWNAMAVPAKSSIKSTSEVSAKPAGKRVVFKKEKYQCVYEYPREPSDDEDSPDPWHNHSSTVFDYSSFADWELGDGEVATCAEGDNSDTEDQKKPKKSLDSDFYRLNYSMGPHLITEDGEFFISSSSRAFEWNDNDSSEFFPGRVSDDMADFAPEASELTPLSLGELRHTKDSLRLELPVVISNSRNPDKAEASFLDSGIDTASPPEKQ